ncbi:5'-deoxynucleotidase [Enterovibrio norvegicus FF-33]|uniref:5'-deoxynucleotidase n=1 Tax=Enterovibrio norvegicus FF-454 TaxID=1185651 RepID=A0A1E5C004_9GAMM|nr:5'-deoxynucleotidase [Enterovibrio norvegicus]OEE58800.1 5'-deoxynucleotidase [Enterovibrio norvegicus FF-454]OEE68045.1 5'-deoxynucleotidase [Enterovibrio norvegicus FF-33]OEE73837.1 5'-deoxynucleotidase [Enterovibrio norvegicus FF-162]
MSQKHSHFFAHLARMKLIYRWPLMRNVFNENISEHSLQVAFVAHALALIENRKFGGNYSPERVALLAMFHDCSEVLTGDLPTPIKYFNPAIADEYKKIERIAEDKLVAMLPEEFRDDYRPLIDSAAIDAEDYQLVKQADSICAYLKCLEELSAGNHEFEQAKRRLETTMEDRGSEATAYFMSTFGASFGLTLDEISDE